MMALPNSPPAFPVWGRQSAFPVWGHQSASKDYQLPTTQLSSRHKEPLVSLTTAVWGSGKEHKNRTTLEIDSAF